MTEQRRIRVAVVFGGRSSEHAISCAGAGNIIAALDPDRYEVIPIGITTSGRWLLTSGDPSALAITGGRMPSVEAVASPGGGVLVPAMSATDRGLLVLEPGQVPRELGEVDVVFPVLHGAYGEDGTLQGLLELSGTRYVGAGVLSSAVGMDKEYMKLVFAARGLPTGPFVVVRDRDWQRERKRVIADVKELGWPVFVKPARSGSSIGVGRAAGEEELVEAVEAARRHDPKVLVEAAISGREIEVGVLEGSDGDPPYTSLPCEILVTDGHGYFDFDAKYLDDGTVMDIPAKIPASVTQEVQRLGAAAFEAISCEGLARVDCFYTPDGRVLLNEINTMPGISPVSVFPMVWRATGLDMPALADRLIQTALRKPPGLR